MLRLFTYGAGVGRSKAGIAALCVMCASAVAAEPVEIVALGDSLTAGYGLREEDGFVPKMQAWLDAQGLEAKLINAGVSGDTTAGGLSRAAWSLSDTTDAIMVALGGNDLLRGLDPALSRSNLDGIMKVAQEADLDILIVGMEAPGNYGPDYKTEFDSIYPDLAEAYGALYFPRFFEGLASIGETPAELRDVMQPDGIHPNAAGVDLIVEAMGPSFAALIDRASH